MQDPKVRSMYLNMHLKWMYGSLCSPWQCTIDRYSVEAMLPHVHHAAQYACGPCIKLSCIEIGVSRYRVVLRSKCAIATTHDSARLQSFTSSTMQSSHPYKATPHLLFAPSLPSQRLPSQRHATTAPLPNVIASAPLQVWYVHPHCGRTAAHTLLHS